MTRTFFATTSPVWASVMFTINWFSLASCIVLKPRASRTSLLPTKASSPSMPQGSERISIVPSTDSDVYPMFSPGAT